MRNSLTIGALLLATFSTGAAAQEMTTMSNFSYDYFEARMGVGPLTYGAAGSMSIHPNAHILVEADTEFEGDFDTSAGIGFHAPVNNWADVTGELLLRNVKKDHHSSDFGVEVNLGVRQWLAPQFEVGAQVGNFNLNDNDEFFGSVYGRFHATELFSIGAQARFNEWYGDQVMLSARFKF
ncbi:hypothetical protein NF212_10585 [Parasalinivibrio latis]|uniref:hypothetical protein n=1 Tax=Parasalinivibrio latis TaxID=2952610 RepID=UPI0030DE89E0